MRKLDGDALDHHMVERALAGTYGGASGDIDIGVGAGANFLWGGSERSVALQPISVEGSVGLDVTLGVSALTLQWVP